MSHLIPISPKDFKTLSKQYLSTLKAEANSSDPLPTLMQAQELLAKACGHQSLHEANRWWASQSQPVLEDAEKIDGSSYGPYNIERAMSDQVNVDRLRERLLVEASKMIEAHGEFNLFEVRRAAEIGLVGHDIYTLFHVSNQMQEDGTFLESGKDTFSINEHLQWAPTKRSSPNRRM